MACDGCHTPRPGGHFDMSRRFSGGSQTWDEHAFTVKGSNITRDRETGIGSWSAADSKRLMVEGRRPNGVTVAPQMPFAFYKILTPSDLDAVTAYVLSMQPVRNEVQPPTYKAEMTYFDIPGGEKPYTDADLKDPNKRGFYLATIAHCMECHSRTPDYKPVVGPRGLRDERAVRHRDSVQHYLAQGKRRRRMERCGASPCVGRGQGPRDRRSKPRWRATSISPR
jgi:hypothetical protein